MDNYYIGQRFRLEVTFTSVTGVNTDPTMVNFYMRSPLGVRVTYVYGVNAEVTNTATGVYHFDATPDKVGIWKYRFEGTGIVTAVDEKDVEILRSGAIA